MFYGGSNLDASVKINDNYIVTYSGNASNGMPLQVHCAYNIKYRRFVHMDRAMKNKIQNMLITQKGINLKTLLAIINGYPVPESVQANVDEQINYLTAGNPEFTKEQVVEYILTTYPELREYSHYQLPVSVYEYDEIEAALGTRAFFFHVMPQVIDLDEADQIASLPKKDQMKALGKHPSLDPHANPFKYGLG